MATPATFVEFSRQRGLSPDGRCRAFAAAADGTGFSEGVGLMLVERLSDAVRNGHPVLAVVRGSAVNQDGASNGLTAPNGSSQQQVIAEALASAGLTPADVDAVEAHGTGTTLGDPVEANALLAAYGSGRPADDPLWVGSLKSNIGHTQAAAGVGGIIKMVQALRHSTLPRTLHVDEPSPHVDWSAGGVSLLTEPRPWPAGDRPRRFGVSAFGMSGTNAHVILEEAPPAPVTAPTPGSLVDSAVPLVLSARSGSALRAGAARLRTYLVDNPSVDLVAVAAELALRSEFDHRAVVVAASRAEALDGLAALVAGEESPVVVTGHATGAHAPVFVYPGQGAQWPGMGRGLLELDAFRARVDECATALGHVVDWSVIEALTSEDPSAAVDVVQPALWAMMTGLTAAWAAFGVRPAAVIGHSQGEIAAALAAGALSTDEAAAVSALRSKALRKVAGGGAMLSVTAPADVVRDTLGTSTVDIAAVNGPSSTVVAGPVDAVREAQARFEAEGIRARLVDVDYASHSVQMEQLKAELLDALPAVAPRGDLDTEYYSTVTGARIDAADGFQPEYWYRNLRQPVLLQPAVEAAVEAGHRVFVEVSPHPVVSMALQDVDDVVVIGTLRRGEGTVDRMLASVAEAWVHGVPVDWTVRLGRPGRVFDLPTYAFDRQRLWLDAETPRGTGGLSPVDHPILTSAIQTADGTLLMGRLATDTHPWLADHAVGDTVLLPGAALAEMAAYAGNLVGTPTIEELTFQVPLVVTDPVEIQVSVATDATVTVHSRPTGGEWTTHASGSLGPQRDVPDPIPARAGEELPTDTFYTQLDVAGYHYGPSFRGLRRAWRHDGGIDVEVVTPDAAADPTGFRVAPWLLDATVQAAGLAGLFPDDGKVRLPFAWRGFTVFDTPTATLRARLRPHGDTVAVTITKPDGTVVAAVDEIAFRVAENVDQDTRMLYDLAWVGVEPEARAVTVVTTSDITSALAATPVPDVVAYQVPTFPGDVPSATRATLHAVLDTLRTWSAQAPNGTRLAVVTRGAVAAGPGDRVDNLPAAAVWGLVRSAQNEEPGQFLLVDTDTEDVPWHLLAGEPQAAVRDGRVLVPRARPWQRGLAIPDEGTSWHLGVGDGSLDDLVCVPDPDPVLAAGQVLVAVRASGLNFRDAMLALGMYPGEAELGTEGAGVVIATGADVTGIGVGDRVLGLISGAIGPRAVADHRMLAPVPAGWSFAEAAAVPAVYLTAYYALRDLAGVTAGESLLVHSAAGGVGWAATQLARHWGVEVFGTASPSKWPALDLPADHLASSRDLEFATRFPSVDVVLNSLTGDFVDASLGLLAPGGRFVEMGKTDLRQDAGPGYRAFDLMEAGPARIGEMLGELVTLFDQGAISPPPVTAWNVGAASDAFRYLSQARHVGKVVLRQRTPLDRDGTVLVTGGTGGVGRLVAAHLAEHHGIRHFLLLSRGGGEVPAELRDLDVTVAAVDVTDEAALGTTLVAIPAAHPLTGVFHAAGVLDDATIATLTPERLDGVLRPKVDGAWNLHRLTRGADLAAFVLFSSAAGVVGSPGQAAYAAANVAMDALAVQRQRHGLPATSVAWGLWQSDSAMTGSLSATDLGRLAGTGLVPMAPARALALLDRAMVADRPNVVAAHVDQAVLARRDDVPAVLQALAPRRAAVTRPVAVEPDLAAQLATVDGSRRYELVREAVHATVAVVLGGGRVSIDDGTSFKELGFDSLTAVELRNRLGRQTGLRLAATVVFDHPNPAALTSYLLAELTPEPEPALERELAALEAGVRGLPADHAERARLRERALAVLGALGEPTIPAPHTGLDDATPEELFHFIDSQLRGWEGEVSHG
ncbi:hypothetical protein GCM10029964_052340 [Kibdelosporangium lantanae]